MPNHEIENLEKAAKETRLRLEKRIRWLIVSFISLGALVVASIEILWLEGWNLSSLLYLGTALSLALASVIVLGSTSLAKLQTDELISLGHLVQQRKQVAERETREWIQEKTGSQMDH